MRDTLLGLPSAEQESGLPLSPTLVPPSLLKRLMPGNFDRLQARYGSFRLPRPVEADLGCLGRSGNLEVRLATSAWEVRRAQNLRYRVFYREMAAVADARTNLLRRDADMFDRSCDHLLVLDHGGSASRFRQRPKVVGTYRLLRQDIADRHHGFYSQGEYDIAALVERKGGLRFLELGRSCVMEPYRSKRTLELLWRGIWAYVVAHRMDVMIGCASLAGTDPDRLALPLSYLHHTAAAPEEWRVRAKDDRRIEMNRLPKEAVQPLSALRALPPLIKGYLRTGAYIGDGAVIDRQFGTTDVCIIMPVAKIGARYIEHYAAESA